ncbi:MAG TPA: hypothetical protein VD816_13655 [Ohtaekwangia sp.]|nr:hypothetical protein [Ohtaekwangia sp.]
MKVISLMLVCCFMAGALNAQERRRENVNDKTVTKLIAKIAGRWELSGSKEQGKDKTARKDTIGWQWMEFDVDAKYRTGSNGQTGATQAIDSGSYRLNEAQGILYLQSSGDQAGTSNLPTEWDLTIKGNTLTLSGRGGSHAQRFKFTYTKTKEALSTNP